MKRLVLIIMLISGCITQVEDISREENRWIAKDAPLQNLEEDLYDIYSEDTDTEKAATVSILLLLNSSCTECYDVNQFAEEMSITFGFVATKEEIEVDTIEGRELIERYNITKIPTFILSEDALEYPGFEDFWKSKNNTMEGNGWMVFRSVAEIGAYYLELDN